MGIRKSPQNSVAEPAAKSKVDASKEKVLQSFLPDVREFLKDNLGLDVERLETKTLYDIIQGKLTAPLDLVVTPTAYDVALKDRVEMPKIKVCASVRLILPMENGKPVPMDDEHKVHVSTVPCRPYLVKSDVPVSEYAPEQVSKEELPTFSDKQLLALEGVGIERSRMFGGYNRIPVDVKRAMAAGEPFPVDGAVRTSFGIVNVIGTSRLVAGADGHVRAGFESSYPQRREAGMVIDIVSARRIGALELDFFRRGADGRAITNVNGAPVLNSAGVNVITYGSAMEPVKGFIHRREFDKEKNAFTDKIETAMYQVTAVNGNLFASKMVPQIEKNAQGEETVVGYNVSQARVNSTTGQVFVSGSSEPLDFASDKDRLDFLAGRGGVVKNASYHDFKTKKDVTYDAFVVPDNTAGGYAHQFTPETSRKLIERREKKVGAVRRQNFSMGLV